MYLNLHELQEKLKYVSSMFFVARNRNRDRDVF